MALAHPHVNEEVEHADDGGDDINDDVDDDFRLHFVQRRRSMSSIHDQSTSEQSDD